MSTIGLGRISALLCVQSLSIRNPAQAKLYAMGCRDIECTETPEEARKLIASRHFDFFIADIGSEEKAIAVPLFRDIRDGRLGRDPFVPLVAVTAAPVPAAVKAAINAGADDVLPFPWGEGFFEKRLDAFVFTRRPFVLTESYFGPDRRKSARDEAPSDGYRQWDVPNALKAKAVDRTAEKDYQDSVTALIAEVNTQRLKLLSAQAIHLAFCIFRLHRDLRLNEEASREYFAKMEASTLSMVRRLGGTEGTPPFEAVSSLRAAVAELLKAVKNDGSQINIRPLMASATRLSQVFEVSLDGNSPRKPSETSAPQSPRIALTN